MMNKNNVKSIIQNIGLFLAVLIGAFLVGEFAVRLLYKDDVALFPRYHTDATYGKYTIRRVRSNAEFWHTSVDGSWQYLTNDRGFRNRENFTYAKPDGVVRILSLGDSHTQGFEVRQDFTFSAVIEKYLNAKGHNVQVLNTGVSGFGTAEQLILLENEGIKYEPDFVVLGFYANDYENNITAGLFQLDEGGALMVNKTIHVPGVRIQNFIYSVPLVPWLSENSYFYSLFFNNTWTFFRSRLVNDARDAVPEYAIPTRNEASDYEVRLASALLRRMYDFCRDRAIPLIIIDIPKRSGEGIRSSFNSSMRSMISSHSDGYIDSVSLLEDYRLVAEIHRPNGHRHISEFTHVVLGLAAAKQIESVLH